MIDQCPHTFAELATTVLPRKMTELCRAMAEPMPLSLFMEPGIGPKAILKQLGRTKDFSGCYLLLADGPFYVGISRKIVSRLRDHLRGSDHFTASLAHMMAVRHCGHNGRRIAAAEDPRYVAAFSEAKCALAKGKVAFVEISNPLELYLFEVYAAMELDTATWNTFATH
jgi:predicted GIY-YIG superfamily endonuclease